VVIATTTKTVSLRGKMPTRAAERGSSCQNIGGAE
jgi:hypothetical protein